MVFFFFFLFRCAESNVHIRHAGTTATAQDDSHGTLTLVGPVMKHDIPTLQRSKNLSVSVCLWVKSLTAKWIILQLLLHETHIILRLSSPHYIHKSPNLLHTAVKKIIITIETHLATSTTPLPFFLQIPSAAFFPCRPHSTTSETQHACPHTFVRGVRCEHKHTHNTHISWFVLGVISLTQGTVIMYFLCFIQGVEEIRDQQTAAKPDTNFPTWGGSRRGALVKVATSLFMATKNRKHPLSFFHILSTTNF